MREVASPLAGGYSVEGIKRRHRPLTKAIAAAALMEAQMSHGGALPFQWTIPRSAARELATCVAETDVRVAAVELEAGRFRDPWPGDARHRDPVTPESVIAAMRAGTFRVLDVPIRIGR